MFLYRYYEKNSDPFLTLTSLPFEEARALFLTKKAAGEQIPPNIDTFLQKRYDRDKILREAFVARGGNPVRTSPIYMMRSEERRVGKRV